MDESRRERSGSTPFGEPDPGAVAAFWARYVRTAGAAQAAAVPSAWCFGDSPELADELIELVVRGSKRATVAALAEYEAGVEPVPTAGELSIALDGSMRPRGRWADPASAVGSRAGLSTVGGTVHRSAERSLSPVDRTLTPPHTSQSRQVTAHRTHISSDLPPS